MTISPLHFRPGKIVDFRVALSWALSLFDFSAPRITYNKYLELKHTPGRGYGLFAKQPLPPGTLVVKDEPILTVPRSPDGDFDDASLYRIFNSLPRDKQRIIWKLHYNPERLELPPESILAGVERLKATVWTNSFSQGPDEPGGELSRVFPNVSRFNHSCVPNTMHDNHLDDRVQKMLVRTRCHVAAGEEVTISYLPPGFLPFNVRNQLLFHLWGFQCMCPACNPDDLRVNSEDHELRLYEIRTQGSYVDDVVAFDSDNLRRGVGREALEAALERAQHRIKLLMGLDEKEAARELIGAVKIAQELWRITKDLSVKAQLHRLYADMVTALTAYLGEDAEDTKDWKSMLPRSQTSQIKEGQLRPDAPAGLSRLGVPASLGKRGRTSESKRRAGGVRKSILG